MKLRKNVSIMVSSKCGGKAQKASQELHRYIHLQSGAEATIKQSDSNADVTNGAIVIGTLEDSRMLRELAEIGLLDNSDLKQDDFLIKKLQWKGSNFIAVLGMSDIAVLYGCYALLEKMGWVFQISKDVLPEKTDGVPWPDIDMRFQARAQERSFFWVVYCPDQVICSLSEYSQLFDQMVKLRFNTFYWWDMSNSPCLDYIWRGEHPCLGYSGHPDTAYFLWRGSAGSFRTDDLKIGSRHFSSTRLLPPEFENCQSEQECLKKGKDFLYQIFDLAVERGIKVGFTFDPSTCSPNHGRFMGGKPEGSFAGYEGTSIPPHRKEMHELNEIRIKAIMDAYPQVSRLMLNFTENSKSHESPEDLAIYEKLIHEAGSAWDKSIEAFKIEWVKARQVELELRSALGHIHRMRKIIEYCNKNFPELSISALAIGRGCAAHIFDALLPSDIGFADLEGACVYFNYIKNHYLPLEIYGEVPKKRSVSIMPRLDDDAHTTGINFHVRQFIKDGMFDGCSGIGMNGMDMQPIRPRGHEHNFRFLAENLWEKNLGEDAFYERYCKRLFGKAAEIMQKVYTVLENENERMMSLSHEDQGYMEPCWAIGIKSFVTQPCPINGPFCKPNRNAWATFIDTAEKHQLYGEGIERFKDAIFLMSQALPLAPEGSKNEITYLMNRVEVYKEWTSCLVDCKKFSEMYEEAFSVKQSDYQLFANKLSECRAFVENLYKRQYALVEKFSEIIDSFNDRGLLFRLNRHGLTIFGEFLTMMRHIDDFHHGRPYWQHRADWNRVNDGGSPCVPYGQVIDEAASS